MEFEYGHYVTYKGQRFMVTNWNKEQTQLELYSGFVTKPVGWVSVSEVTDHTEFMNR